MIDVNAGHAGEVYQILFWVVSAWGSGGLHRILFVQVS